MADLAAVCTEVASRLLDMLHADICQDDIAVVLHTFGYRNSAAGDHSQELMSSLLAAELVRLLLPLMRLNLKHKVDKTEVHIRLLRCMLLPQWGETAVRTKTEFLNSGRFCDTFTHAACP